MPGHILDLIDFSILDLLDTQFWNLIPPHYIKFNLMA
jgi:hypothetical protein